MPTALSTYRQTGKKHRFLETFQMYSIPVTVYDLIQITKLYPVMGYCDMDTPLLTE